MSVGSRTWRRRDVLKASVLLLGTAASASVTRALLADELPLDGTDASPFTDAQRATVSLLADMIIPPTDTPGAVDAGVPDFIASIFRDWYTDAERTHFLQGLAALDAYCDARESRAFNTASEATRLDALRDQENIARQSPAPPPGPFGGGSAGAGAPFFNTLKELVVLGYYTSEVGATQELVFLPAPGRFDGNADLQKAGRQWTR